MTTDEAFNALIQLAREIKPGLPDDLSNHVVTISMSIEHSTVLVRPLPERPPLPCPT